MSEEIRDFDEQVQEIIAELQRTLTKDLPKLKGKAKLEKCQYLKNRMTRARQLLKSYNVELRELNRADAKPWEDKGRAYDQELNKISDDLTWATTAAERDDLFGGSDAKIVRNADDMSAKELISEARAVQDQSMAATGRAKEVLAQTLYIGTETSDVLKEQTEQINEIQRNVDMVETNLKRADKQIRVFVRRMASDKVIMSMVLLVVLALVTAIIVSIVKRRVSGDTSGDAILSTFPPINELSEDQ